MSRSRGCAAKGTTSRSLRRPSPSASANQLLGKRTSRHDSWPRPTCAGAARPGQASRVRRRRTPPSRKAEQSGAVRGMMSAMLLAVDVGNTQTVFGLYVGDELGERFRIATESQRTGDELGALLSDFLDFDALAGIARSSTVPRLIRVYEHVAWRWAKAPLLVVGPGVKTGIQIQYEDQRGVGRARVLNADG